MKNILIIYPHWPPSNLVGVHRVRLIANYLNEFNWHPVVLTVNPDYYEEKPDYNLLNTVSELVEVHYSNAFKISRLRIVGDIGLRGFFQIRKIAIKLLSERKFEFIWISIPSFYTSLLGRILYQKTGVPYGIDYQDPWIRDISNRKNLRSVLSILMARLLEPYSLKKARLISGVAESYYKPVIDRYFKKKEIMHVGMPLGFDPKDHLIKIDPIKYPWEKYPGCIPFIYAGAFLPKSDLFIRLLFKALENLKSKGELSPKIKLFFVGTGNYFHKSIAEYASDNNIESHIIEIRERFPFLDVLNFLSASKGVLLIGSTEEHYTASKTFQTILSNKPVFSILHYKSSAVQIFKECKAASYLCEYNPDQSIESFSEKIEQTFLDFTGEKRVYEPDLSQMEKYSAKQSAKMLVEAIEKIKG